MNADQLVCPRIHPFGVVFLCLLMLVSGCEAANPPLINFPTEIVLNKGDKVNESGWWVIPIEHENREAVTCTSEGLPPGINLDQGLGHCAFYGRAAGAGVFNATVIANAAGAETQHQIRWTVHGDRMLTSTPGPVFTNEAQSQLSFYSGENVRWLVIEVADGSGASITCRADNLVDGLDFDQDREHCALYGTIAAPPGRYKTTVTARNDNGLTNQLEIAIIVSELPAAAGYSLSTHPDLWFNQPITHEAIHSESTQMINRLADLGGFGLGRFQIDFSIVVNQATATTETRKIAEHPDGYYAPDCEPLGTTLPVPSEALLEGRKSLDRCDNLDEDCHLIVLSQSMLYEVFQAGQADSGDVEGLCLAIWDLSRRYPAENRGEHCTSADAAGWPITPLLFHADEVAAAVKRQDGDLGHAIRFILPNRRMASDPSLGGVRGRLYVRPASHAGAPTGPPDSIPYGSRLRLRADFPVDGYNPAAVVLLNTMKRFGIALADGGNIALTGADDVNSKVKWADLDLGSRVFVDTRGAQRVRVTDFEVIDTGPRIGETYECRRSDR
ncbi:MAG: hypothetical protein AB8B96_08570 [Lysobacterales bacterium]